MKRAEKIHLSRVAELGCIVCRRIHGPHDPGPVEIHHLRAGTGAGRRSSHWDAIPLCPEHHRGSTGFHGLGTKGFPKHWGFDEHDLLQDTVKLIEDAYGPLPSRLKTFLPGVHTRPEI
jgi:hypothetical protein